MSPLHLTPDSSVKKAKGLMVVLYPLWNRSIHRLTPGRHDTWQPGTHDRPPTTAAIPPSPAAVSSLPWACSSVSQAHNIFHPNTNTTSSTLTAPATVKRHLQKQPRTTLTHQRQVPGGSGGSTDNNSFGDCETY